MRIAIVADFAGRVRGGIEWHAQLLQGQILNAGHSVSVFSRDRLHELALGEYDGLVVEGVFRPTLLRLASSRGFGGVRKVLFTHGSFYEEVHRWEMRRAGVPTSVQSWVVRPILNRLVVAPILKHFDGVFTLSEQETQDARVALGGDPIRFRAIPILGFPSGRARGRSGDPRLDVDPAPYVVAIARVHRRKNFLAAVQAIEGTDISFILAGQDGGDLGQVLRYARRHGVKNFRYVGEVDTQTKDDLVLGSLATILPSWFEGVPYGVLDSLAVGRPCITTCFSYLSSWPGVIQCLPRPSELRAAMMDLRSNPQQPSLPESRASDREIAAEVLSVLSGHPVAL